MNAPRDLAFDLIKQQKFSEALELLPSLIESNPDDSNLQFLMGQCFRFTNKIPEAINCFIKATNLSPNAPENFLALGIAYQLNENFEQAIDALKKAIDLVKEENLPRYPNLQWYLDTVGLDFKEVISVVNQIPKLY